MTSLLAVALLAASATIHAKPAEVWKCKDLLADNWKSILVTATVDSGRAKGDIVVAGITQQAVFRVQGFDRRWDFGRLADGSFRYSFIIKPNGDAAYYDFGIDGEAQVKPSNFMKCRQSN